MNRAVFLDRDGTLIESRDYLADPRQVVLVPGATEAVAAFRGAGYRVVVVTNQSGIARGLISIEAYHAVAGEVERQLAAGGARLDATYFCPHHPDLTGPCDCRKPGLRLYRQAAAELDVDLTRSAWVGDQTRDVLPAAAFGGRAFLIGDQTQAAPGIDVVRSLAEVPPRLLER